MNYLGLENLDELLEEQDEEFENKIKNILKQYRYFIQFF